MKITVLGGIGYIGCHLTPLLLGQGHDITVLDSCTFGTKHLKGSPWLKDVRFIKGHITHAEDLAMSIKGSDCVIHLAGLVGDPSCSKDAEQTWLDNVESSYMIADVCNYYNVQKLLFASSCSVYGAAPTHVILNEGSYRNPVSLYAKTKIESEKIFAEKFNNVFSALRLSTVFGYSPRMRFDLVVNLFTIRALKENKLEVFGGTQYRPFINCVDVARAFYLLMRAPNQITDREVFNVCSENYTILGLGKLVSQLTGAQIEIVDKKEDDRNYQVDYQKANWLLKFSPSYTVEGGIRYMMKQIKKFGFDDWKENRRYYNSWEA